MQPTADFDPGKLAKSLLRRSRQGALATLMTGTGDPYCSLVNLASHPDGSPILLISRLAVHTRNLLADNRVSLMLDERAEGDPLEGARIMLSGWAEQAGESGVELQPAERTPPAPFRRLFGGGRIQHQGRLRVLGGQARIRLRSIKQRS